MRSLLLLLPVLLTAAAPASPFDGTWKTDPASVKLPVRPDVLLVKDGTYTCTSCTPKITIPANGQVHRVAGYKTYDAMTVTVTDPRTISYTYRQNDRLLSSSTDTVSADGKTLTTRWRYTATKSGDALEGTSTSTRVGAAPAGAHPASGSWQADKVDFSDAASTMTLAVSGKTVKLSYPTGETLEAVSGGPFVPLQSDPAGEMNAMLLKSPRVLEWKTQRGGEVTAITTLTVAADGRTLKGSSYNPKYKTTTTYTSIKQ